MILSLASFLMRGRIYYCIGVLLLASMPFLLWLSAAFVVLITLRRGAFEGACALLCALLPLSVMMFGGGGNPTNSGLVTDGVSQMADFWMLQNLIIQNDIASLVLAYLAAITLRATVKLNVALLFVAVGVFALVSANVLSVQDWVSLFETNIEQIVRMLPPSYQQELLISGGPERDKVLQFISGHYLSLTLVIQVYVALLLGRWFQAGLYYPGGFGDEFRALSYSGLMATVLILVGLFLDSILPNTVGVGWVLTAPLVVAGAALVHAFLHFRKGGTFSGWLIGFYLLLPLTYSFVAILGWFDAIWKLRSKFAKDAKGAG